MATSNSVIKIGSQFDALIGLTELTGFNQYAKEHTAPQVVSIIQQMALITERVIAPSRGCIVKYLGDAALSVFPDHAVNEGVRLILIVRQKLAEVMKEIDCPCRLCIRAHFGPVIGVNLPPVVGPDVIGHTINVTARFKHNCSKQSGYHNRKTVSED